MTKLNEDDKYERILTNCAREKGIEFHDYSIQLPRDQRSSESDVNHREVEVTATLSKEQMCIVNSNMLIYDSPNKLTEQARFYALTCKGFPNNAVFQVSVKNTGATELKIIGSSVYAIEAVVHILLS